MPREHYWLAKWSPRQEPRGLRESAIPLPPGPPRYTLRSGPAPPSTTIPGGLTPSPQNFDQKLKNVSNCSRTALERFDMPECPAMETV